VRPDKSLTPFEIRLYKHYRVVHGCRIALAFVLTFVLVRLLDVPEGTWPLITLVVVMGPISFWGNVVPRLRAYWRDRVRLGPGAYRPEAGAYLVSGHAGMVRCRHVPVRLAGVGQASYQALLIGITLAVVVGAPAGI
jgi:hypothetical protein